MSKTDHTYCGDELVVTIDHDDKLLPVGFETYINEDTVWINQDEVLDLIRTLREAVHPLAEEVPEPPSDLEARVAALEALHKPLLFGDLARVLFGDLADDEPEEETIHGFKVGQKVCSAYHPDVLYTVRKPDEDEQTYVENGFLTIYSEYGKDTIRAEWVEAVPEDEPKEEKLTNEQILGQAVVDRREVTFSYKGEYDREARVRYVEPEELDTKHGIVVGFDVYVNGYRQFRLDRIEGEVAFA